MKKLGWTMIGAALGVVLTASMMTSASAQPGKMTLFGEAPKGAESGATWNFKFADPKTGKEIATRKGEITVQNGRYLAEVDAKDLDPGTVYSLAVAGEAGEELAPATFVTLQGSTPGVAESGNINVTGTIIAGKISTGNGGSWPYLVNGHTTTTTGGVFGASAGNGVRGVTTDATGGFAGGSFKANHADSFGIYSLNTATTGAANAGYFKTMSENGTALQARAETGIFGARTGVYGLASGFDIFSMGTAGVKGELTGVFPFSSYGVHGIATSGPGTYAVYGTGDTGASGMKLFEIDHPGDPGNKWLRHYCAEGAEPLLTYSGTIKLDASGRATVTLPDYWALINKDPRYQLTAIGGSMPGLHVASEVANNRFVIAGGVANGKVSWTVTGTRNDPYVQRNGIKNVVEKPATAKGKYHHPELYGQPASSALTPRAEPTKAVVNPE